MLGGIARPQQMIDGVDLLVGTGNNHNHGVREHRVRGGQYEFPALPQADDVGAGGLAQTAFAQGFAHQGRAHDRGFGHHQFIEAADHAGAGLGVEHAAGQGFAQQFVELKDMAAAGQLQDVDGVFALGRGHNGHLGVHVAGGEHDVGIAHVAVQGHQHGGLGQAQVAVDLAGVVFAHHRVIALIQQVQGGLAVTAEQHAMRAVIFQIVHQVEGNGTGADHNDVPFGIRGNGAGRMALFLGLQPRGVKKLDKGEG